MNTKFRVQLHAMSEAEILDLVPPRVLSSIKAENHNPILKAFVVGGEGRWDPQLVGIGPVVQNWFKSAIQALANKLKIGTPVYNQHAPTNDDSGRTAIGEIIATAVRKIKEAAAAVAVTYIYPEFEGLKLDVASIEADVMVEGDGRRQDVEDDDILDVTGVALGNSAVNTPAFPGATLLATLQAFAESKRTPGGDEMTLDDLKKAISDGKYRPSDLFDGRALVEDPFIVGHVKEEKSNEFYARKRSESELADKIKKLEDENKAFKDQIQTLSGSALSIKAKDVFKTVLTERPKLNEDKRLSRFIETRFSKDFKPAAEGSLKADIDKFVDAQVTEYQDLFGETKPQRGAGGQEGGQERHGERESESRENDANLEDLKKSSLFPKD